MSGVLSVLTSALSGGFIGTVGSLASKWLEGKQKKEQEEISLNKLREQNAHEKAMVQMQLEGQKNIKLIEAEEAWHTADFNALAKSLEADSATYSKVDVSKASPWLVAVDFVRGMMRPLITGSLVAYCVWMSFYIFADYGAELDKTQMAATVFAVIDSMSALTGLAVSWWFGSRVHGFKKGK